MVHQIFVLLTVNAKCFQARTYPTAIRLTCKCVLLITFAGQLQRTAPLISKDLTMDAFT